MFSRHHKVVRNLSRTHSTMNQKSDRISSFKGSIFTSMTMLSIKHKSVNLGQGAPDFEPADFIKKAASEAALKNTHQYTRAGGALSLVTELSNFYSPSFNKEINPMSEILVGGGATEVCYSAMMGLVNPGDEVIIFEPFYDAYAAWCTLIGAIPKFVPLKPCQDIENHLTRASTDGVMRASDYTFDPVELSNAITDKTRMIILNTPHNPLGKVFTRKELEFIADLVRNNEKLIVLSDEVYENLIHSDPILDESPEPRFASLPGMFDRSLTVSTAGKTYSITGWKLGWGIGGEKLIEAATLAHQFGLFCIASPLQTAMATIIPESVKNGFLDNLKVEFTKKRDMLYEGLKNAGLNPILPQAGYFVVVDGREIAEKLGVSVDANNTDVDFGEAVAIVLTEKVGVTCIPVSAFYSPEHKHLGEHLLRFAYCKKDEVIFKGVNVLENCDLLK